jgi:hypothetical protein
VSFLKEKGIEIFWAMLKWWFSIFYRDRVRKEKVKQIFAHAAGESSEFKKKRKK